MMFDEDSATQIRAQNLSKRYGDVQAVDNVSFTVQRGEVFGLLGHNGAGKTTTIRMLTGRAKPTGGAATIAGYDTATEFSQIKPLINLVFEDQNLYERLSGRDNLRIFADLYNVPRSRVDELLERVGLSEEAAKRKVKTYSTGMKQRLMIARAIINSPQVLLLDEPTKGLDPTSARELRELIRELAESGVAVLLCTHYMEEADELCHKVAFLSNGKLVALDSPTELKLQFGSKSASGILKNRDRFDVSFENETEVAQLNRWLANDEILTIHSDEATLADVFVSIAGRPLTE